MNHKRVIGVSGTNGAGKDTVGQLLASQYNFLFISVSDLLRDELRARNLPPEREHMRALSAEWRRTQGLSVLVDQALKTFETQAEGYDGLVIASLRNPFEADRVHELGGTVVWVDADPKIRFDRLQAAKRKGREGDDSKSFEQFLAEEAAEMHSDGDETALNMSAVRERADTVIMNNSVDLDELAQSIKEALFN